MNALFNESPTDAEWLSHYDPEVEFQAPPEWPEGRVYRGRSAVGELANAWTESFDEYRWDEERIFDAGDRVVALWHHRGRLQGSRDWVERQIGTVWYFREGKIVKVLTFFSWAEALEAAGVPG
jgi:ketosteroid isomerase-like protein